MKKDFSENAGMPGSMPLASENFASRFKFWFAQMPAMMLAHLVWVLIFFLPFIVIGTVISTVAIVAGMPS